MKGKPIRKITPYLYVLPALLLAFLFCYRPLFANIIDSLSHVATTGKRLRFVGLENYRALFSSDSFQASWNNTFRFAACFVPLNLTVTFSLALCANVDGKMARIGRNILLLPIGISMSSIVLIFKVLFDENVGLANRILGHDIPWFSNGSWAMAMLVIVGVWLDVGFDFLLFSASLRNIPKDLEEVADLEGATAWERLRYLEFPLVAPTFFFVLLTNLKDAMLICSPVIILTEGGPFRSTQTLVYQMYLEGFKSGNIAMGSAISTVVFLVTLVLLLILMALQKRRVFYQ